MIDPASRTLEQYVLATNDYEIINIFQRDEIISSPNISCVSFTMKEVINNLQTFKE
ncbi:hypothetical protein ACFSKI_14550 [Pseudogracilibacillus auburnensis]|uniref:hypothetical protein n=1 Tax=Pseudogracilibacillus auburnensis TaxID=1494959 RepID=UPI002467B88F|nr:hypothetical protein [Pseudogracilibacillus auburnensis]